MEKLQFRVLYREFLFRVVDLELLAPDGDMSRLLGQFAALLIFVSLWLSVPILAMGGLSAPAEVAVLITWAGQHFLIATTMLVVGLFAVLSWDSMFPDRRDVLVLGPLPVRARTLLFSKVMAVATALSLTILAINCFTGLAAPGAFASAPAAPAPEYDPAMPPVPVSSLGPVLHRDLEPARHGNGALAPGTEAGVVVGVLQHGERRIFVYGTAKPDSIFEIGSISKTFTGLILARMVAEGKTRLDEPVRDLLPPGLAAKPKGDEVRLLDLATHHSGLPRMPDNFSPANITNPYADYLVENLYEWVKAHGLARPSNPPFQYSNLGFGLLGQALAVRGGMSYANLLRAETTGPLGLNDTVITLSGEQQARFIQGHNAGHQRVHAWDIIALAGAGAIRSTAGDMLTYLEANLHPDKTAFPAALTESHVVRAEMNSDTRIAIAWMYDPKTGTYFHGGATAGYSSFASFNPHADIASIVLVNTGPGLYTLADLLGNHINQRLTGKPAVSLANNVGPAHSGPAGWLRCFAAYWLTMLASGVFLFCAVAAVQGLAQLLPRQVFLRLSSWLQMAFFVLLTVGYFLQAPFASVDELSGNQRLLMWLPSYWFFGLFQQLNGPVAAGFETLVVRAWVALAVAVTGAVAAYLICYFRTLRKIVEQPDIVAVSSRLERLPRFGTSVQTAIVHFSIRSLFRSRQHRVILAFYLGMALAFSMFLAKAPMLKRTMQDDWTSPNPSMLVASILIMCAAVLGTRIVFALPLELRANWILRVLPIRGSPECLSASRRALLALAVAPVWTVSAIVFFWLWQWRPAAGHLLILGLIGAILVELCLHGFQKIPFTCSYQPGKSYAHMVVLGVMAWLFLARLGAEFERGALAESPGRFVPMLALLATIALILRWRNAAFARSGEARLEFEDAPAPAIQALGL